MSNAEIVMLVGGAIAIVLGAINGVRTGVLTTTDMGVIVLGIVLVLLSFI